MADYSSGTLTLTYVGDDGQTVLEQLRAGILRELFDTAPQLTGRNAQATDGFRQRTADPIAFWTLAFSVPPGLYHLGKIAQEAKLMAAATLLVEGAKDLILKRPERRIMFTRADGRTLPLDEMEKEQIVQALQDMVSQRKP